MISARGSAPSRAPFIRCILHPTDFSEASMIAFAHAVKAALVVRGKLVLLHVTEDDSQHWDEFPGVRETLERWRLLPPGSSRQAVLDLGIDVTKVVGCGPDPTAGVLEYVEKEGADLIVLATHHRGADWLRRSLAQPLARRSGEMTLFVPADMRNFISLDDGEISLRNVLIPISETPSPEAAIAGAVRFVEQLDCGSGRFTLLHVGDEPPSVITPTVRGWTWQNLKKSGNVIDAILDTAKTTAADLIVMSTDGRDGFLDAFRGSHSERVLRHAPCPLLAVPEASYGAFHLANSLYDSADAALR